MNRYFKAIIPASMLILGACSSQTDEPVSTPGETEVSFLALHPSQQTRTDDNGFVAGDRIGIYMTAADAAVQSGGNELNNELFNRSGAAWKSERKVYWNEGAHDVYAYYPYIQPIDDVEEVPFSVSTDQSSEANYFASDLLWASTKGVAASVSPVPLSFSHRMSRVIVQLAKGDDFEGELPSNAEVYIYNTVVDATMSIADGGVAKLPAGKSATIHARKLADDRFAAIVVPQNIQTRQSLVEVVVDDVSYLMDGKISLRQGVEHTITVTLAKNPTQTKIDIGGSIGPWTE